MKNGKSIKITKVRAKDNKLKVELVLPLNHYKITHHEMLISI